MSAPINATASFPSADLLSEFPIKERFAFFNHAGVSPIPVCTMEAITQFARMAADEGPTNYPAWLHGMTLAREAAGELLGCPPEDVCFTKSTNHGLLIVANSIRWKPGDNVVCLEHEFPANITAWRNLAEWGVELRLVPEQPDHTYSIDAIRAAMDSRTRLLAVSWVEYSTGVRNNIEALAALARERNIMISVDGIQGLGILPINVLDLGIDFIMADGHKWLLGPEGCGILYVKRERIAEMNETMCGWCGLRNPQDYGDAFQPYKPTAKRFEEGSHNLMSIRALGTSLRLLLDAGIERIAARIEDLTGQIIERALSAGWTVKTPVRPEQRAGIVAIVKDGVDTKAVAADLLAHHKIAIAARRNWLRIAPHFYNDEAELDRLFNALPK
jgi:selenocysteine lyase/cysteine desulfurase